jgi:hypothetical protein
MEEASNSRVEEKTEIKAMYFKVATSVDAG